MSRENNISYFRKLIYYFKSCEVSPTVDEEDRLWNNIMSEISASKRRRRYELNRWRISLISLGVAAMLSGIVWILQDNNRNELHSLYVAYQAMDVSTHIKSDKVKILTGEQELVSVDNGARIDYTKSDEKLVLGDREVAMPDDAAYHQLVVPNAKHASLVLSDGSVLYVNAGTRVVYPDKFKKDYREIFVDGEVYIDVVKNEKAPFKVHTTSCDIEVLGTSFNVQAYSSDTNAEVVLLRGSVKLKDKHEEELLLQPDELAVIMGSSIKEKKHVNASDYILWTKGLLKLDATPLSAVFKRLERYYGVKLTYPEEMKSMNLYGSLDLQCSLEEVLRRISLTAPISFQKMDNEIEIHINNVHKNN